MFATHSPQFKELIEQTAKLARSEYTILLQGESGTGKERLAWYIHNQSARASAPFVKLDCATVPESLWDSELFGHVQGAFVGATEAKLGMLDLAAGGSLYLDEIAEIPISIQLKLLRVLNHKTFDPVGGIETRQVDARIIAATTRDLAELKDRGYFREDLYYRLSVLRLTVPPLRERKEDIQLLSQEILSRQVEKGMNPPPLTAESMAALLLYDWPGNIRELDNALRRAFILAGSSGPIERRHLPPEITGALSEGPPRSVFKRYVKSAELLIIHWALSESNSDRTKAAQLLGISRAALFKKLKIYQDLNSAGASGDAPAVDVQSDEFWPRPATVQRQEQPRVARGAAGVSSRAATVPQLTDAPSEFRRASTNISVGTEYIKEGHNAFATDATAIHPPQLDTAIERLGTLVEALCQRLDSVEARLSQGSRDRAHTEDPTTNRRAE